MGRVGYGVGERCLERPFDCWRTQKGTREKHHAAKNSKCFVATNKVCPHLLEKLGVCSCEPFPLDVSYFLPDLFYTTLPIRQGVHVVCRSKFATNVRSAHKYYLVHIEKCQDHSLHSHYLSMVMEGTTIPRTEYFNRRSTVKHCCFIRST